MAHTLKYQTTQVAEAFQAFMHINRPKPLTHSLLTKQWMSPSLLYKERVSENWCIHTQICALCMMLQINHITNVNSNIQNKLWDQYECGLCWVCKHWVSLVSYHLFRSFEADMMKKQNFLYIKKWKKSRYCSSQIIQHF